MTNREFQTFVKRPRFISDTAGVLLYEDQKEDKRIWSDYYANLKSVIPFICLYLAIPYYLSDDVY